MPLPRNNIGRYPTNGIAPSYLVRFPPAFPGGIRNVNLMTASQPKTIVQHAWRAFAGHDYDTIAACFTEDAEWLAPNGNATAKYFDGTSHMVGRAVIAQFVANDFPKLFAENVSIEFRGFYAEGDRVTVEETMSATLSNGNAYRMDYCFVFELKDGLIHRVREYMDTAAGHRMVFGEQSA